MPEDTPPQSSPEVVSLDQVRKQKALERWRKEYNLPEGLTPETFERSGMSPSRGPRWWREPEIIVRTFTPPGRSIQVMVVADPEHQTEYLFSMHPEERSHRLVVSTAFDMTHLPEALFAFEQEVRDRDKRHARELEAMKQAEAEFRARPEGSPDAPR